MIICGYAGIGKSFLSRNFPMVMDLESTPFEKDWERYAKCAVHYHKQGYLVLVSCHKEIREKLIDHETGVPYGGRITVVPNIGDKELYCKRYIERGNTAEFIKTQMDNWEKWLDEKSNRMSGEQWEVMESGETLRKCIVRLSKEQPHRFCNYDACPVGKCSDMVKCVNPLAKYVGMWNAASGRQNITERQREILTKDLCGRLLYDVRLRVSDPLYGEITVIPHSLVEKDLMECHTEDRKYEQSYGFDEVKPYLRPMSSMTGDEFNEYTNYITNERDELIKFCNSMNFYNRNHFDYRGLIDMGLALPAPDGMYNSKEQ